MVLVLLILFSSFTWAKLPMDIVFDIDQTLVTLIHEGPQGDILHDKAAPSKNTISIEFEKNGERVSQRYRVFDGLEAFFDKLQYRVKRGEVRISFFSGGENPRNFALLEEIKLSDGSSLKDLSQGRIYGAESLTKTGAPESSRYRERFNKDLTQINPDLSDLVLVDDIIDFVPVSQRAHVLWLGEEFPYPERPNSHAALTPELIHAEKNKYQWIESKLMPAIEARLNGETSLAAVLAKNVQGKTPLSHLPKCTPPRSTQELGAIFFP
jgi:hypothetical protein